MEHKLTPPPPIPHLPPLPPTHTSFQSIDTQEASDPQPTGVDERAEPWRAAVDKAMQGYVKEHYPNGILTVSSWRIDTVMQEKDQKIIWRMCNDP